MESLIALAQSSTPSPLNPPLFSPIAFDEIVRGFYIGPNQGDHTLDQQLQAFSNTRHAWTYAKMMLQNPASISSYTQLYAFGILQQTVNQQWNSILTEEEKRGLRKFLVWYIPFLLSPMMVNLEDPAPVITKANLVLVSIAKQEWPHGWPLFLSDMLNDDVEFNNLSILKLVFEEMFSQETHVFTQARMKEMNRLLENDLPMICTYLNHACLRVSSDEIHKKALEVYELVIPWLEERSLGLFRGMMTCFEELYSSCLIHVLRCLSVLLDHSVVHSDFLFDLYEMITFRGYTQLSRAPTLQEDLEYSHELLVVIGKFHFKHLAFLCKLFLSHTKSYTDLQKLCDLCEHGVEVLLNRIQIHQDHPEEQEYWKLAQIALMWLLLRSPDPSKILSVSCMGNIRSMYYHTFRCDDPEYEEIMMIGCCSLIRKTPDEAQHEILGLLASHPPYLDSLCSVIGCCYDDLKDANRVFLQSVFFSSLIDPTEIQNPRVFKNVMYLVTKHHRFVCKDLGLLKQIMEIIQTSIQTTELPSQMKQWALEAFLVLCEKQGRVLNTHIPLTPEPPPPGCCLPHDQNLLYYKAITYLIQHEAGSHTGRNSEAVRDSCMNTLLSSVNDYLDSVHSKLMADTNQRMIILATALPVLIQALEVHRSILGILKGWYYSQLSRKVGPVLDPEWLTNPKVDDPRNQFSNTLIDLYDLCLELLFHYHLKDQSFLSEYAYKSIQDLLHLIIVLFKEYIELYDIKTHGDEIRKRLCQATLPDLILEPYIQHDGLLLKHSENPVILDLVSMICNHVSMISAAENIFRGFIRPVYHLLQSNPSHYNHTWLIPYCKLIQALIPHYSSMICVNIGKSNTYWPVIVDSIMNLGLKQTENRAAHILSLNNLNAFLDKISVKGTEDPDLREEFWNRHAITIITGLIELILDQEFSYGFYQQIFLLSKIFLLLKEEETKNKMIGLCLVTPLKNGVLYNSNITYVRYVIRTRLLVRFPTEEINSQASHLITTLMSAVFPTGRHDVQGLLSQDFDTLYDAEEDIEKEDSHNSILIRMWRDFLIELQGYGITRYKQEQQAKDTKEKQKTRIKQILLITNPQQVSEYLETMQISEGEEKEEEHKEALMNE